MSKLFENFDPDESRVPFLVICTLTQSNLYYLVVLEIQSVSHSNLQWSLRKPRKLNFDLCFRVKEGPYEFRILLVKN